MKYAVVSAVAIGIVAAGLALSRFAPSGALSDEEMRAFGFVPYPEPREIPAFRLADAHGGAFGPDRLAGRWTLLFFGYANCPDICPVTMSVLGAAEERLLAGGHDVFQGVLVTVDPERDGPDELAAYVRAFSPNFIGVTGPEAEIRSFAGSLHAGFAKAAVEDSALGYLVDHTPYVVVIDPAARHRGYIRPPLDAQKVAALTRELARRPASRA